MGKKGKRLQLLNSCVKQIESLSWKTLDGEQVQIKDIFICPLCLDVIYLSRLKEEELNHVISLEDVPPKSIGGKPILVTCKKCNNKCGHDIDVYLRNELIYREDIKSTKGRNAKISFDGIEVNSTFSINDDNSLLFSMTRANDPKKIKQISENMRNSGKSWTMNAQITLSDVKRNSTAADVALLKSAYLLAFKKLGYAYIFNSRLSVVREQIDNPKESILSNYIVGDERYIKDYIKDGVYRAYFNDMEILMVVFSLQLDNSEIKLRKAIALPPVNLETDIYEALSKSKEFSISIIEEIPDNEKHSILP